MTFKLRTKPTQSYRGKTEETLCDIMARWEENRLDNHIVNSHDSDDSDDSDDNDDNIKKHLLDIIVTNNSLLETDMWKYRTVNKFKQEFINIHILSSKSNDFTNITSYINEIHQTKKKMIYQMY